MNKKDKQVDGAANKGIKMSVGDWIYFCILCCFFAAFFSIVEYAYKPSKHPEYNQVYSYQDSSDIEMSHETGTEFARITVKDRFRKDDTDYYIFTTSITGDTEYTFSEEQYDAAFGLSNNAFDCRYYTLTLTAPVVQYKPNLFGKSSVSSLEFELSNLPVYEPYIPYFDDAINNTDTSGSIFSAAIDRPDNYEEKFFQRDAGKEVVIKKSAPKGYGSTHSLSCEIKLTRYSFLGEEDFTEEEIASYKEELDDLSHFVMDSFYDSF